MELLQKVAGYMSRTPLRCAGVLALTVALVALGAFCGFRRGAPGVAPLVVAQLINLSVVAEWVIGAPTFAKTLRPPAGLERVRGYAELCEAYRDRMLLCPPRKNRFSLAKAIFVAAWAVVGVFFGMMVWEAVVDPLDRLTTLAIGIVSFALCMFSYYLCFVHARFVVDLSELAEREPLPYYPAAPAHTAWYREAEASARRNGMSFLLTSLLFVSFMAALGAYCVVTGGFGAPEAGTNDLWVHFSSCVLGTAALGLLSFLVLHYMTRLALSSMLDSWEAEVLRIVQRGTRLTPLNVDQQLRRYESINRAMGSIRDRPAFDKADAVSIVLAALTLVVAALTLVATFFPLPH